MSMFIDFPKTNAIIQGLDSFNIPPMCMVHQEYDANYIKDVRAAVVAELAKLPCKDTLAGKNICITVGSRGIPYLDVMVKAMCDTLKAWGAKPFIIPAMGSHGGGNAEGQLEILNGYGITEEAMEVPIKASMEVVQYGEFNGIPLYCDKYAFESDGIVLFNKVKPHTDFRGAHESGLLKMIAIGIAKHKGAAFFHTFGFPSFPQLIPPVAEIFLQKCPVAFGVGVVQNAFDDICTIKACMPEDIIATDAELLVEAKEKIAKFLFNDIDLLIIDEIGKNISGNGHDPNVTGRNLDGSFQRELNLKKLFIRGLTPESHHNGCGLAAADITLRSVLNDVDWDMTWTNGLTTGIFNSCKIPFYAENDDRAIRTCLKALWGMNPEDARIVHVKNTLELSNIQVSRKLYESIKDLPGISLCENQAGAEKLEFDADGNMKEIEWDKY